MFLIKGWYVVNNLLEGQTNWAQNTQNDSRICNGLLERAYFLSPRKDNVKKKRKKVRSGIWDGVGPPIQWSNLCIQSLQKMNTMV